MTKGGFLSRTCLEAFELNIRDTKLLSTYDFPLEKSQEFVFVRNTADKPEKPVWRSIQSS